VKVNVFFKVRAGSRVSVLRKIVLSALGRLARKKGEVNLVFVGAAEIRRLNRRFLGRDRATDVIAFNYPPSPAADAAFGDVFVCVPQAKKQAAELGHSLKKELAILSAHGALHLAGMDDKTQAQAEKMDRAAQKLATKFSEDI